MASADTLDFKADSSKALQHMTSSKVVSGAVVVTFPDLPNFEPLLFQGMSEPQEETMGGGGPVHVLHRLTPLEQIAPVYAGGSATLTLIEGWDKTPYQQAGFSGAEEFIDIINHEPFKIQVITYVPARGSRPKGNNYMELQECRVMAPVSPNGNIERGTMQRTMTVRVAYTRLVRRGFAGTPNA